MKAIVTQRQAGKGAVQFPVQRVQSYTTDQSIDNDVDSFSVDIVDEQMALVGCVQRDVEVQVDLFLDDQTGRYEQIFSGLADEPQYGEDYTISISGRDVPSAIAVDSDALPTWIPKGTSPKSWIQARAQERGITRTAIAGMSLFTKKQYTDGSETEWALWYRIARMRDMYMWSDNVGTLIIDKLGYALAPSYKFGQPPVGQSRTGWIKVEPPIEIKSNKQQRIRQEIIYGETGTKKAGNQTGFVTQSLDTTIASWQRKPRKITTSTKAKTAAAAKKEADEDIFESIVGAQEITLTVQDTGILIQQNRMCQVNLPQYGIVGTYFVVGVQRAGGSGSPLIQTVRLRERGFALSKRIPDAPTLAKTGPDTSNVPATGIADALTGIRWNESFVKAAREFGVPAGWDFSVFLGALLSICYIETGFHNVRQTSSGTTYNHIEWFSKPTSGAVGPFDPDTGGSLIPIPPQLQPNNITPPSLSDMIEMWRQCFANDPSNPLNPMHPNSAGVGPMQLTSQGVKDDADAFGWTGSAKVGEMDGGRWNPDSNIRAAAKLLVAKGNESPPVNPTDPTQIWIAVARYNGSGSAALAYAQKVKAVYNQIFASDVSSAIASVKAIAPGSSNRALAVPGHGTINVDPTAPVEVAKALNWCLARLGDPYKWGGFGPYYDCSSFVTAALSQAATYLHTLLNKSPGVPDPAIGAHGQTTITLFAMGTPITKDALQQGDLVFFLGADGTANAPGHVGMYMGDGLFIQDPSTGDVVKVSSLGEDYYRNTYVGARRFVKWASQGHGD